jgi:hypothetical protein
VERVNEDGLKSPDDYPDLWLSVRDCLWSMGMAGKKATRPPQLGFDKE